MKARTIATAAAVLVLVIAGGIFVLRSYAISAAEKQLMTPYKDGPDTPATFGVAYAPLWIDSSGRKLQASLVRAPASCDKPVAVLLFHGRGETISSWAKAQAFFSRECVSSMVFDYSGFGNSTPPAHIGTVQADAVAVYRIFVQEFNGRRCVLGHSMGNAPMLHAYPAFDPKPDCVVIANAFSSVEEMARVARAPAPLAMLLHGVWDNTRAVKAVAAPLMIVHSDADETIPAAVAEHLYAAAPPQTQRLRLHGFYHNALLRNPSLAWWKPVLTFLSGGHSAPR